MNVAALSNAIELSKAEAELKHINITTHTRTRRVKMQLILVWQYIFSTLQSHIFYSRIVIIGSLVNKYIYTCVYTNYNLLLRKNILLASKIRIGHNHERNMKSKYETYNNGIHPQCMTKNDCYKRIQWEKNGHKCYFAASTKI